MAPHGDAPESVYLRNNLITTLNADNENIGHERTFSLDHVHFRHLSAEYQMILLVNMATQCWSVYWLILDRHVNQLSVTMRFM